MISGGALLIVLGLIAVIWIVIEFKRFEHKIYAYVLIALVLFITISFSAVASQYDIDYSSPSGIFKAGKVYFTWIGSVFGNIKSITSHAINLGWKVNESVDKQEIKNTFDIS